MPARSQLSGGRRGGARRGAGRASNRRPRPVDAERPGTVGYPAGGEPGTGGKFDEPGAAEAVARLLCLRQLESRSRTRVELARYLERKGIPQPAAVSVLDRLTEVGLIDDAALAKAFTLSRHEYQGLARRAIAVKLRQRGVADETIAEAAQTVDTEGELDAAYRLAVKKMPSLVRFAPEVQLRRMAGMLGRKGHPPGVAFRVAREVVDTHRGESASEYDSVGFEVDGGSGDEA